MRSTITGGNVLRPEREPRSFCAWWVMTVAARDVFEDAGAGRWLVLPDAPTKPEPADPMEQRIAAGVKRLTERGP